jgi:diadenylate cyclase
MVQKNGENAEKDSLILPAIDLKEDKEYNDSEEKRALQKTLVPQAEKFELMDILKLISFGTPLRAAIEKISYMNTGGLIIIGNEDVLKIIRGGFSIDCKFTSNRLAELAKMDGALVLNSNMSRILYAGTLLVPDPNIKTNETGSRHQAAERASKQTGQLSIAVSQRTGLITLYYGNLKYRLKNLEDLLSRTRATLENMAKYKKIIDELLSKLNLLEVVGFVEVYDVVLLLQRMEIVTRIEKEVKKELLELGKEAGFFEMEYKEHTKDLEKELLLIIRDYKNKVSAKSIRKYLSNFSYDSLLELENISIALGYSSLHEKIIPKGYRFLTKVKSLSPPKVELITKRFKLKELFDINIDEFTERMGIDKKESLMLLEDVKKIKNELIAKL